MRNGNIPVCLSLLFVVVVCAAAGISPLATQKAHIGPYQLLLSFYSLPRTEQLLNMTIQSTTPGMNLRFSQPVLTPAPGTDATAVHVTVCPRFHCLLPSSWCRYVGARDCANGYARRSHSALFNNIG